MKRKYHLVNFYDTLKLNAISCMENYDNFKFEFWFFGILVECWFFSSLVVNFVSSIWLSRETSVFMLVVQTSYLNYQRDLTVNLSIEKSKAVFQIKLLRVETLAFRLL